ncbi:MAG: hypothetical protein WCY82_00970 [Desulfotomaculaceae bacterium]
MRLLICIDDTDNLESRGTGWIASEMLQMIETKGWGKCGFVTRHQLLLHPDVPYTSHNSAMCFNTEVEHQYYEQLKWQLAEYLGSESAAGSDPGICIADLENINHREELIEFGFKAKCEVLNKDRAYRLAAKTGVFLTEKGGSGDGVIGSLAGVGLRLNGNDGEVKGGIGRMTKGMSFTVAELMWEELITGVYTTDMKPLADRELVTIKWKAKPVLYNGRPVLLVVPGAEYGQWLTMDKSEMRQFGDERTNTEACGKFKPDVPEEMVSEKTKSCFNCIYRRWTENSFLCALEAGNR